MNAVSKELRKTILELQTLPSVSKFALGGGTNLAIRYQYRISIDIDFLCPDVIGRAGFGKIIYDLDFITYEIPLTTLYHQLSEKEICLV